MTSDLLKIETVKTEAGVLQAVSAKALHARLGVKRDFSTWIKSRIDTYGFVKDTDYFVNSPILGNHTNGEKVGKEVFTKSGENLGGRPNIDYNLTLDMAKELAMLEKNESGRAARKYFIACEAELKKKEKAEKTTLITQQRDVIKQMEDRLNAKITDLSPMKETNSVSLNEYQVATNSNIRNVWNQLVIDSDNHENALAKNAVSIAIKAYANVVRLECLKKAVFQYERLIAAFVTKPTDAQKGFLYEAVHKEAASLFDLVMRANPFDFDVWYDWQAGHKWSVLENIAQNVNKCWEWERQLRDSKL
jgi:phage anti-repressor protein